MEFDSIKIGSSVSLAWRVFVLPGTEIGDGAVIGANSLVRGRIPPRSLAVGYPARVVSKEPEFPRSLSNAEKEVILDEIVHEFLASLQGEGLTCRLEGDRIDAWTRRRWFQRSVRRRLQIVTGACDERTGADADVVLSLHRIPGSLRSTLAARGVMWLDIEAKERSDAGNDLGEETAIHLRRHGVRFFRVK